MWTGLIGVFLVLCDRFVLFCLALKNLAGYVLFSDTDRADKDVLGYVWH